jgi:alpha-tubulin suppressor-like RCC1 family protein
MRLVKCFSLRQQARYLSSFPPCLLPSIPPPSFLGNTLTSQKRISLPDGEKVARVFCGGYFSAILGEEGSVWTWGLNDDGQLGFANGGATTVTPTRVNIPGDPKVVDVACGLAFVVVITENSEVWGWGENKDGEILFDGG